MGFWTCLWTFSKCLQVRSWKPSHCQLMSLGEPLECAIALGRLSSSLPTPSRFSVPLWSASNAVLSEGPFKGWGKRVLSKIYLSLGDLKYTSESSSIPSPLCWSSIISFLRKDWGSVQGNATWKLIHIHIDGTHHGIQTYSGPPTNKNVYLQNKYMWQ